MTNEEIENWYNIYVKRVARTLDVNWSFDLENLNTNQRKWIIELKEISRVSKLRETYHYKLIDKLLEEN